MNPCLVLTFLAMMVASEAPYEPIQGKVGVAYVAITRAELHKSDVLTVLRQRRQFYLNPRAVITPDDYTAAWMAYHRQVPDPTQGADHFYNAAVKPWPFWYDERFKTVTIGRHTFLKLGGF